MRILLQNIKNGKRTIEEIPYPNIKNGRIIVENHYSAISIGTEKMITELASMNYLEKAKSRPDDVRKIINKIKQEGLFNTIKSVMNKLDEPMTLGYSASGIVKERGSDISEFNVGDRVAIGGGGFVYHGEVCMVPSNLAVKVPDNVKLEHAAFATIAAIGIQGMRIAEVQPGENVCVIGLGLLGLITAQILIASGCNVYGIEPDENKRKLSEKLGVIKSFDINYDLETIFNYPKGRGFDKIIITASSKDSKPLETAAHISRDRGIISIVGATGINVSRNLLYSKELTVKVSRSYGAGRYNKVYEDMNIDFPIGYIRWTEKRNMEFFIDLLEKKKINMEPIISAIYDFDESIEVYDQIMKENNSLIGILLKYKQEINRENKIIIKEHIQTNNVNIGIIGSGNFVKSTMLENMKKTGQYSFIGISDRTGKNSLFIAKKYGFSYSTTNYKELLEDKNINLIVISTNHASHSQFIIEALEKGKDVYCEKPIAINKEQLNEIKDVLNKTKKRLFIGYNRRFSPHTKKIKEFLLKQIPPYNMSYIMNAGYIPKEHWVNMPEEGGRIIGEACHIFDLFVYMANSKVKNVYWSKLSGNRDNFSYESEANIIVEFENGSSGNIIYTALGNKNYPKEQMKIFVNNKIVEMNNYKKTEFIFENRKKVYKTMQMDKGFYNEYILLAKTIKEGKEFPIPENELFEIEKLFV